MFKDGDETLCCRGLWPNSTGRVWVGVIGVKVLSVAVLQTATDFQHPTVKFALAIAKW